MCIVYNIWYMYNCLSNVYVCIYIYYLCVSGWFRLGVAELMRHERLRFAATLHSQFFLPKRPFLCFSCWEIATLWRKVAKAWDERQPKEDCEPRSWQHFPQSARLVVSQEWHQPNQRFHQWDVPRHYLGHLNTSHFMAWCKKPCPRLAKYNNTNTTDVK